MKTPEHSGQEREVALERALTSLYDVQKPEGFDAAWRAAIHQEEHTPIKPFRYTKYWKIAAPTFAALVLVAGSILTGAINLNGQAPYSTLLNSLDTNNSYSRSDVYETQPQLGAPMPADIMAYDTKNELLPAELESDSIGAGAALEENSLSLERKVIRTANLFLTTSAFDVCEASILQQVKIAGGYVENMNQYEFPDNNQKTLHHISFTLQIPTDNFDTFICAVSDTGQVISHNENVMDKTIQYSDAALRLQIQLEKMARLQELLIKGSNATDLIEMERTIADTQYEIDSCETKLRIIDRQADNGTINIFLQEDSLSQSSVEIVVGLRARLRLGLEASLEGTGQFFQNMLVFLVTIMPVLVPLAAVCVVI